MNIRIGRRIIGDRHPCFIIAEAGINHNGNLDMAMQLIDHAKQSGADCIKFQTFNTKASESIHSLKPSYFKGRDGNKSKHDFSRSLEFSRDQFKTLREYCGRSNIMFLSTATDLPSLKLLISIGVDAIKIGSSDTNNFMLLKNAAQTRLPIFLSTGISTFHDIQDSVDFLRSNGSGNVSVLQCTSQYPVPYSQVNLNAMKSFKEKFSLPVGYSDHSAGYHVPVAAVAAGANIIEKHFTLSRNLPGVDHIASIEPFEFKLMVKFIRDVEQSLGNGIKEIESSEKEHLMTMRKSIVAARGIRAGKPITEKDITVKRPGTGLSPKHYYRIIGKKLNTDLKPDDIIKEEMIDDFQSI